MGSEIFATPQHVPELLDTSCTKMALEICESECGGCTFFAVQNGGTGCFCGSEYGRYGESTNCTMPCAGNAHEICGGPGANSIYRVQNTSTMGKIAAVVVA
jgi:hypothetical protein